MSTQHDVSDAVSCLCPYCGAAVTFARLDGAEEVVLHAMPPCPRFVLAGEVEYLNDVLASLRRDGKGN